MDKYLKMLDLVVPALEGTFLVYFIPLVTVIGCGALFYYGFKGLIKKDTNSLYSFRRTSMGGRSPVRLTGNTAVATGFIYINVGILLLVFLGTLSYKLLMKI